MNHHQNEDRTESLKRLIPDLFDYKTVLYVGARADRIDYIPEFAQVECKITVVEVHPPNAQHLRTLPYIQEVILADISFFQTKNKYDIVFWWHGPEHVEYSLLGAVLDNLESMAKKAVVCGCPWGKVPQGPLQDNPYEEHVSFLDYPFFEERGYVTECLGNQHLTRSNITAVKYV